MFLSAWGPRRSASCAKYRLAGATGTPCESRMPSGKYGGPLSKGRELSLLFPIEPISQLAEPGGFWMIYSFAEQFQATPQPIDQPSGQFDYSIWGKPRRRKAWGRQLLSRRMVAARFAPKPSKRWMMLL